jgi:hypothetical protein
MRTLRKGTPENKFRRMWLPLFLTLSPHPTTLATEEKMALGCDKKNSQLARASKKHSSEAKQPISLVAA